MSESATASAPAKTQPKAKKNRLSSGFFRFVLTRFLLIIPTVFILVTIVFFVMRATGDPISAAMGGRLTPEELQRRIHAAGYDRPLVVQYLDYLGGLLRGETPRSIGGAGGFMPACERRRASSIEEAGKMAAQSFNGRR